MRNWAHVLVQPHHRMFCNWCGRPLAGTLVVNWAGGVMDPGCAFTLAAHSVMVGPGLVADNPEHRHCTRRAA